MYTPAPRSSSGVLGLAHRALTTLEWVASVVAAICLFAIMVIVFTDVIARYFFNAPLAWSFDFISMYLMIAAFFLALSHALQAHEHVAVDILLRRVSRRTGHAMNAIGAIAALVIFACMGWVGFGLMVDAIKGHDTTSGVIEWPTWISYAFLAFGVWLLVARLVYRVVAFGLAAITGRDDIPGTEPPPMQLEDL